MRRAACGAVKPGQQLTDVTVGGAGALAGCYLVGPTTARMVECCGLDALQHRWRRQRGQISAQFTSSSQLPK
jgi:hypothetical protein